MSRFLLGALTAALLFGTFSLGSSATAAESAGLPPQNTITMNFQNVDIPVLAKFISEITGRNFIIDESVRGKVTIISPSKVTPEQAYSIFQSVLQVKGFTTVQAGKIIKIEPARNVRSNAALTTSQNPAESSGDEYVTRMVRLKNIDAAAIIGVIQPMISHDGLVAAFPGDNTIIVTDDAYNVERLVQIIGELDVRGEQASIVVIPLKLAFAGELAPEIDQLMGAKNAGGQRQQSADDTAADGCRDVRHRSRDGLQSHSRRAHQLPDRDGAAAADARDPGNCRQARRQSAAGDLAHPRLSAQKRAGARDGPGA